MNFWHLTRQLGLFLMALLCGVAALAQSTIPENHKQMNRTISYPEMMQLLGDLPKSKFVTVTEEGTSVEGRKLMLVNLNRGGKLAKFRVFYFAQQHGDEVSGKDALLVLIRDIARNPDLLPPDIDLYVMPMVNPDGAQARTRLNAAGVDLNRDHLLLSQPETKVLHQVARHIRPHLTADGHEFGKDSNYLSSMGLHAWPDITMDSASHPLLPEYIRKEGVRSVHRLTHALQRAGHNYRRYLVGGPPPDEEMRPSTPEADDARNSMGSLGALSFIIEAGVHRKALNPQADLGRRVDGYLVLLRNLWGTRQWRQQVRTLTERAHNAPLPPFIPTNAFWGNVDGKVESVRFKDAATHAVRDIASLNLMTDLIVKGSVSAPKGYAVLASAAIPFTEVLRLHGIRYETLDSAREVKAERVQLVRVETDFDATYQRYENRFIVQREREASVTLTPGTVWVPLDQELALRAVQVLEPCLMYGVYVYPRFQAFALTGQELPVLRVF